MAITLLLGGARSGKSARAEALAKGLSLPVCYVATAPHINGDKAWESRIIKHQKQRPADWLVIEEPLALVGLLQGGDFAQHIVLVDCLTLWLSNMMFAEKDINQEVLRLCEVIEHYQGEVIFVSNEVGLGLVPETELGRNFRDAQGRLNQAMAKVADKVEFIAAGLPLKLK
ncbi:MAG TPA: bifunctional adenosylcobinamide kinase/adenosylcobinamide-phosphate guanylyltransferase [Ghiorsea sp.]|nr:bifunctional adenosylcobinamide kinase/adenosylcobinamide-phosphate guanylyltransferase [Ghiorsea sp.]HIP06761.1 bifunctional adenosylcobinamide kinase/adenosylcobinamide-phosphate guanylyltransferase [Mariprofundaceae bacterium]